MRRPENLKFKYILEKMTLCDIRNIFPVYFFEGGELKIHLSWSLKAVNTSIVYGNQESVKY